jgi:hypothetical protein
MMNYLYGRDVVTKGKLKATIVEILEEFPVDCGRLLLRAFEMSTFCTGGQPKERAVMMEPFVGKLLRVIVCHHSARSIRALEEFCSASSGLRPLLLDRLNDVLPRIMRDYPLEKVRWLN